MSENMNGVSAGNAANKTYANTKYKDTFFRYLFKEKSGMLELYNALFDDCLTDESEIEDCTIEDVFTRQMKNDLAFRVRKKRVIVLTEHQSTLNENMPLRFLMYLGRTYNQMMTTVSEFKKMIQSMYEKGYVLVSPHDMAVVNDDGTMSRGKIMLPEGKIPFVLSEDDVSYYHYMDDDGFATKLVIDDNGDIKCEYKKADGTVVTGDYDVVPILDSFIKQHPDFSYHGRKGILAMTGYNGVLGYRTDGAYKTKKNLQDDQKAFLKANPDFDYDKEVKQAKKVAKAMKKDGWEFASHTWGHRNATSSTAAELKTDNKKWEKYVAPILGKTDMIIFAFGADIGDWEGYTSDNAKYEYYKSRGYRYFCNVDSSQYFVQITSEYFRQGRRNLDGYRMYYNPDMLSDLFDVSEVWDSSRPTPVPEM